jgi:hypothetical protein
MAKYFVFGILIALVISLVVVYGTSVLLGQLPITGAVTGTATVTVATSTVISLPVSTINFGTLSPGEQTNTTEVGTGPKPIVIQNDGNVDVNLTISATDLFTTVTTGGPNGDGNQTAYSFNVTWNETGATGSTATGPNNGALFLNVNTSHPGGWRAMPGGTRWLANCTDFRSTKDALNLHINITVPTEEPAGALTSTITILASQSKPGAADC